MCIELIVKNKTHKPKQITTGILFIFFRESISYVNFDFDFLLKKMITNLEKRKHKGYSKN